MKTYDEMTEEEREAFWKEEDRKGWQRVYQACEDIVRLGVAEGKSDYDIMQELGDYGMVYINGFTRKGLIKHVRRELNA